MKLVRLVAILGFALLAAFGAFAAQPNIVVFIADDFSVLDSEVYGARDVRTPNMRRLAEAGLTFTHAFVVSPSCAPSRAALLMGLMPSRNGAEPNHAKPRADVKKLPAWLKELGYETVAFGKVSHYKHTAEYGFDHFEFDGFHEHQSIPAALKFLHERKSAKPLCIFIGSNWPHVPWPQQSERYESNSVTLPPTQVDTPETRRARTLYYSAVGRMDDELGRVLDTARETLGTNTVVVFTSDHGAQFPFAKWNCYDAGLRVPLIVSWPGVTAAAARTSAMVSWVDLLPTFVEIAGGRAPEKLDGRSFARVLRGEADEHRDQIFATHSADGKMNVYPMRSIRTRDWKLILNLHPEFSFHTHVDLAPRPDATGYWGGYWSSWTNAAKTNSFAASVVKRYHARPAEELYDLRRDPFETNNLARSPEHAARVRTMRDQLEGMMREQGDTRRVFGEPRLLTPATK
jgi:N-sulfoglucosamine sulfohydrolase